MGFRCGIVGLPNVGKSTLFNALTAAHAAQENYPFCTIEPNVGVVPVPDARLGELAALFHPDKVTPTTVEFVDIAGLVEGASKGEGLGNQFLGHIRNVDAIAHVVRCFRDPDVVHVHGEIDPVRDIEVVETELMLADLDTVTKRVQKLEKQAKTGEKEARRLLPILLKVQKGLGEGKTTRRQALTLEERRELSDLFLLTMKPALYVANVAEQDLREPSEPVRRLGEWAKKGGEGFVAISGKIESEIADLETQERAAYLKALGLKEAGLDQLARAGYRLLDLITFFTAGKPEVRAWTISEGTKAAQAAGVIHTDFEKGFIRAECYHYDDLIAMGSEQKVKEVGKMRLEGKDYVVRDGDILYFRFNV